MNGKDIGLLQRTDEAMISCMRCAISGLVIVLAAACGGSPTKTPTSPAPLAAGDACAAVGAAGSGLAILAGEACGVTTSPVAKINLKSSGGASAGLCTGTVVSSRAVLTAAHCLIDQVAGAHIWFGETGQPEIVAAAMHAYPGYSFNGPDVFDVGVLIFAQDLPRGPVPVLTSRRAVVGETAIVAGWGRDENSVTTLLRAGSTRVSAVTDSYLQTLFAPPSASVCSGDSGGPIMLSSSGRWVIAGITSATSGVACNDGVSFYQAVFHPAVRDFIRQHVPGVAEQ
jgi:hypothetical protein